MFENYLQLKKNEKFALNTVSRLLTLVKCELKVDGSVHWGSKNVLLPWSNSSRIDCNISSPLLSLCRSLSRNELDISRGPTPLNSLPPDPEHSWIFLQRRESSTQIHKYALSLSLSIYRPAWSGAGWSICIYNQTKLQTSIGRLPRLVFKFQRQYSLVTPPKRSRTKRFMECI